MGFLAPLYALAALAIAGPLIFHLIRRQPQGQTQFSSLMFLSPSPPRLTRRSRLDNILLLAMRVLALGLIAIAFARPFFRQESLLNQDLSGRNILVLIDTSASMQREDVWRSAKQELDSILASLSPQDRIALYTIDDQLNPVVALESAQRADGRATQQSVRAAANRIEPTWRKTELANGLSAASDLLTGAMIAGSIDAAVANEIVLISDLHTDCGLEALQGFPWPEAIRIDVRRILPSMPGNARPSLMYSEEDASDTYRVRIENTLDSSQQALELNWANRDGPIKGTVTRVQVPPGQVRVVPMTVIPTGADRLSLNGDAWGADNHLFVAQARPQTKTIAFSAEVQSNREDDCGYFLKQAPLNTRLVRREVVFIAADRLPETLADPALEAIVLEPTAAISVHADRIRSFALSGGTVIMCLARHAVDPVEQTAMLDGLFNATGFQVTEAATDDFALFGSIDYRSPVFAPFADPRFNDFSKIRFWSHRNVGLPEDDTIKTVASFDDASPMLVQQTCGHGNIWLLTAGWQPEASTLALSSKFVPMLSRMLDPANNASTKRLTYEVGENVSFIDSVQDPIDSSEITVLDQTGNQVPENIATIENGYAQFFEPGLFRLHTSSITREIAIQIPASESRLLPMDVDVFEQYGVGLGKLASDTQRRDEARQMQVTELERKQRLWQWLIAASILVLAAETWLAGWLSR